MKLSHLICASLVACYALTAKADYQLNFVTANGGSSNPVFDVDGTTRLGPTFFGQLYAGANSGSLVAIGSAVQFGTVGGSPNVGAIGFIIDNAVTATSGTLIGGSAGVYQLRAWTGGATYGIAAATAGAKIGSSSVQNVIFGGTPASGPAVLPPDASLHSSFALTVVPEPATIALGLFGPAGMFFRRRK